MITASIQEYLEIWPRALDYMINFGIQWTILSLLFVSGFPLLSWLSPVRRYQHYLKQGIPSYLFTIRGCIRQYYILVLYLIWGSLILVPIVSFIPIVFLNIRTLVSNWILISLGFTLLLHRKFVRYHARFAHKPTYYVYNQILGLRPFENDILFPFQSIKACYYDTSTLTASIRFTFRVFRMKRKRTHVFQFTERGAFDVFLASIHQMTGVEWEAQSLSSVKAGDIYSYDSITLIPESAFQRVLSKKALKILKLSPG